MTTSHSISSCSSLIPLNWLKLPPAPPQSGSKFRLCCFPITSTRNTRRSKSQKLCARLDDSQSSSNQQQLNLTVLRFTFGIPGLDESYLPRWIGYGFGSLLVLNHFFGSNFATTSTPAQLITEVLGLSLAAFSIALPYLGKFLKGATPVDQATLPEGNKQIFVLSNDIPETQKEDLAWATYILLRNTNAIAVLISIQGELCIRGYWKIPDDVSKAHELDWFEKQVEKIGLSDLKDALYFPQSSDSEVWEMLPRGTRSLLVEPLLGSTETEKNDGFVLLASSASYAFSDKDRAWIRAIANKFRAPIENKDKRISEIKNYSTCYRPQQDREMLSEHLENEGQGGDCGEHYFGLCYIYAHAMVKTYPVEVNGLQVVSGRRKKMQVFVETVSGKLITVEVESSETIRSIKVKMQEDKKQPGEDCFQIWVKTLTGKTIPL